MGANEAIYSPCSKLIPAASKAHPNRHRMPTLYQNLVNHP